MGETTRGRLFWGLLAALACEGKEDPRPAPIPDCNEPGCTIRNPPSTPPSGSDPGNMAGAGGEGGSGGLPPPSLGTLAGTVRMIVEADLSSPRQLDQVLEVHAAGASEAEVFVQTTSSGSFSLEGVAPEPLLWVGVGAFDGDINGTFMDTLQPVDASVENTFELLVMRRAVMEQIAQGFMNNPVLDPDAAHAIVRFVNRDGIPISGITVTFPVADPIGIGYDTGDIYSDQALETSTRGAIALLNLPAAAYPGGLTAVVVENALEPIDINLRVAANSVTLATVSVDSP